MRLKLFLVFILLLGGTRLVAAHEVRAPTTIEHYPLERVSEHIYVVHGTQALPGPQTRGFMNNPAAIIGEQGVIIVDPGSSREIGRELLNKVHQQSDQPVVAIVNTHVHGDHWLGNHGIREVYPDVPIYAHRRMIERVNEGAGEQWNGLFMEMTEGAIADTAVVAPNIGLEGGEEIHLAGLKLKFIHPGHAHTDHDLMVEIVEDQGIFLGDVVADKRVPHSDVPEDASFKGGIQAVRRLLEKPYKVYIPGHGRSGGVEIPSATLEFLELLYAQVQQHYNEGLQDYEMREPIAESLSQYSNWNNFSELGRVISFVYQEVESDSF